jgi:multicomponent Na+:H+ antiporter subunit F
MTMTTFLLTAALIVLATTALGLARVLWGPSDADRIMSAQLLGTGGIATLLLMGVAEVTPGVIDTALTLALLAAFVAIAFAAFFARATEGDAPEEPR